MAGGKNKVKSKEKKTNTCKLCKLDLPSEEALKEHFWSLSHHKKVEVVSRTTIHSCTVCFSRCSSLDEYGKHLKSEKHKTAVIEQRKADKEKKDNPPPPPPPPQVNTQVSRPKAQPYGPPQPSYPQNFRAGSAPDPFLLAPQNSSHSGHQPQIRPRFWQRGRPRFLPPQNTSFNGRGSFQVQFQQQFQQQWQQPFTPFANNWQNDNFSGMSFEHGNWQQAFWMNDFPNWGGDQFYQENYCWRQGNGFSHGVGRDGVDTNPESTKNNMPNWKQHVSDSNNRVENVPSSGGHKTTSGKFQRDIVSTASNSVERRTHNSSNKSYHNSSSSFTENSRGNCDSNKGERQVLSNKSSPNNPSTTSASSTNLMKKSRWGPELFRYPHDSSKEPLSSKPSTSSRDSANSQERPHGGFGLNKEFDSVQSSTYKNPSSSVIGPSSSTKSPRASGGRASSRESSERNKDNSYKTPSKCSSASSKTEGKWRKKQQPMKHKAMKRKSQNAASVSNPKTKKAKKCGESSWKKTPMLKAPHQKNKTKAVKSPNTSCMVEKNKTSLKENSKAVTKENSKNTQVVTKENSRKVPAPQTIKSPVLKTSVNNISGFSVSKLPKQTGDGLKKDSFVQMVKSPRSWRDRHKMQEMMRKHIKSAPKRTVSVANLHLSQMFEDMPEPTAEVDLEHLPTNMQLQISNLLHSVDQSDKKKCNEEGTLGKEGVGSQRLDDPADSENFMQSDDSDLNELLKVIKQEPVVELENTTSSDTRACQNGNTQASTKAKTYFANEPTSLTRTGPSRPYCVSAADSVMSLQQSGTINRTNNSMLKPCDTTTTRISYIAPLTSATQRVTMTPTGVPSLPLTSATQRVTVAPTGVLSLPLTSATQSVTMTPTGVLSLPLTSATQSVTMTPTGVLSLPLTSATQRVTVAPTGVLSLPLTSATQRVTMTPTGVLSLPLTSATQSVTMTPTGVLSLPLTSATQRVTITPTGVPSLPLTSATQRVTVAPTGVPSLPLTSARQRVTMAPTGVPSLPLTSATQRVTIAPTGVLSLPLTSVTQRVTVAPTGVLSLPLTSATQSVTMTPLPLTPHITLQDTAAPSPNSVQTSRSTSSVPTVTSVTTSVCKGTSAVSNTSTSACSALINSSTVLCTRASNESVSSVNLAHPVSSSRTTVVSNSSSSAIRPLMQGQMANFSVGSIPSSSPVVPPQGHITSTIPCPAARLAEGTVATNNLGSLPGAREAVSSPGHPVSDADHSDSVSKDSTSAESGTMSYVNHILQLSMREESIRQDITTVNNQLAMLHRLILDYRVQYSVCEQRKNQVLNQRSPESGTLLPAIHGGLDWRHVLLAVGCLTLVITGSKPAMLLKEEEKLRSERMKILKEAVLESGVKNSTNMLQNLVPNSAAVGTDVNASVTMPPKAVNSNSAAEQSIAAAHPALTNSLARGNCVSNIPRANGNVPEHSGNSQRHTSSDVTSKDSPRNGAVNEHLAQPNPISSADLSIVIKQEPVSDTEVDQTRETVAPSQLHAVNATEQNREVRSSLVNGLVIGRSGTGKTSLASTRPGMKTKAKKPSNEHTTSQELVNSSALTPEQLLQKFPVDRVSTCPSARESEQLAENISIENVLPNRTNVSQGCVNPSDSTVAAEDLPGSVEDCVTVSEGFLGESQQNNAIDTSLEDFDQSPSLAICNSQQGKGKKNTKNRTRNMEPKRKPRAPNMPKRKAGPKTLQKKLGLQGTQLPDFFMQYMGTVTEGDDSSTIISKLASNLIISQLGGSVPTVESGDVSGQGASSVLSPEITPVSMLPVQNITGKLPDNTVSKESFFNRLKEAFDDSSPVSLPNTASVGNSEDSQETMNRQECTGADLDQLGSLNDKNKQNKIDLTPTSQSPSSSSGLMSPPFIVNTGKRKSRYRKKMCLDKVKTGAASVDCSSDSTTQEEDTEDFLPLKKTRFSQRRTSISKQMKKKRENAVMISDTESEVNPYESGQTVNKDKQHTNSEVSDIKPVILSSSDEATVRPHRTGKFDGPDTNVTSIAVFLGHIYVCYNGFCARRFAINSDSSEHIQEFKTQNIAVTCLAVTNKGKGQEGNMERVFLGGDGKTLVIFNAKTGEEIGKHPFGERIRCFHRRWGHLFIGLNNGAVIIFDLRENKGQGAFRCANAAVSAIASSTEGVRKVICVGSVDSSIGIFDASSGMMLRTLGGHTGVPNSLQAKNHQLFSVSSDGRTLVHDICTGELEHIVKSSRGYISSVLPLTVDKQLYILSAGYDKFIKSYNFKTEKMEQVYYGAGHSVLTSMAIYENKIFTGNRDGLVEAFTFDPHVCCPCEADNCDLVFGLYDHMTYHLKVDHNLVRCSWKSCDQLLSTLEEKLIDDHMTRHLIKS